MAAGDITSAVVSADGWSVSITIDDPDGSKFAVGATYNFGSLGDSPATISAPAIIITNTSLGFTDAGAATTKTRYLYGTHVVPLFNTNPDETDTGTSLVVRIGLNECIYAKDKTGVGNSGTNPTIIIAAGWCTSGSNTNNAVVGLEMTNNSTLAYPKVTAQWADGHTPMWRGVQADYSIGCIATHGHGIACVEFTVADQHSNTQTGFVTTKTKHLKSASGLYYESHDFPVTFSGFTAADDPTHNFKAYPLVGDADSVLDTSLYTTSTDDCLGLTQITTTLVTTVAELYVAAPDHPTTPGNDSSGVGSDAAPYATVGRAEEDVTDAAGKMTIIYAKDGGTTLGILGKTPTSVAATRCFIEVRPYPGDTVTLNRGATYIAYKATKLLFRDFTITGNNWLDGGNVAGAKLWFEDNAFDPTTPNGTVGLGYRSEGCFFNNNAWTTRDNLADFSGVIAYRHTGSYMVAGGILTCQATLVASKLIGSGADLVRVNDKSASSAPLTHNILYMHNALMKCTTSAAAVVRINDNNAKSNVGFIGNIIEVIGGTQPGLWVAADSNLLALEHLVCAHNTVVGGRTNFGYNDTGSAAIARTNVFLRNNAFESFNIKGWWFGTPDANRTGNQALLNGVNCSDNRFDGTVDPTFTQSYDGIGVSYVVAKDTTYGQLGYTDDASQDGSGLGNGNYYPTVSSVLYNAAPAASLRYQSYDLYGNVV